MTTITNDTEFKTALLKLTVSQQRHIAALFVENALSDDERLQNALAVAKKSGVTDEELADSYKIAKVACTHSFTQCGKDADWKSQAKHFVAAAAATTLCVEEQPIKEGNIAWHTAMQVRMAKTCENIASGQGSENDEAQAQYKIVEAFLQ